MSSKVIIVSDCNVCPFCDKLFLNDLITHCNAQMDETKTNDIETEDGMAVTPAWCPLKQFKSIVVRYE